MPAVIYSIQRPIYTHPYHYIYGNCVCCVYSINSGLFTSSFTETGWSKLHFIPLVLCSSTWWFAQSENHSGMADFPQGPQGRGEPGEVRHSPFIEHALLFWGGPATFLSCSCAPAMVWYAAVFSFDEHFNSDSLKGQKNHVLGYISCP